MWGRVSSVAVAITMGGRWSVGPRLGGRGGSGGGDAVNGLVVEVERERGVHRDHFAVCRKEHRVKRWR